MEWQFSNKLSNFLVQQFNDICLLDRMWVYPSESVATNLPLLCPGGHVVTKKMQTESDERTKKNSEILLNKNNKCLFRYL